MPQNILRLRPAPSGQEPQHRTAFILFATIILCFWVRAQVRDNIEKNWRSEINRKIAQREQRRFEAGRERERAARRALFDALRNPAPPSCFCASLCQGRGRDADLAVNAVWEHNGLHDDPAAPYLWTPAGFVSTLLAPTHFTNAPFAWPQDATVLLEDYGALFAFEYELPFAFPFADRQCNRVAVSTSGLIFFDSVAYPRGNAWPLATPRHGDALDALAVYYADWQLVEGSTIETFATHTLHGVQGQAFRWKDMAKFGANAGTHRVTFGAVLWETGDVELFHDGDLAELPGVVGAQHHAASWDVPGITNGARLAFSRLPDFEEAMEDLAGDGLNRITKWLWHLDETNPSTARDGVGDAYKLKYNLCPHHPIAYDILVSGGRRVLEAFQHNLDPWKTRADGVSLTYAQSIALGLDPNSNWQPPTPSLWPEDITFTLSTTDTPCLFTFSGLANDPRVQQWALQTNETVVVSIKAWVGCENRLAAETPGGSVRLLGTHHALAFALSAAPPRGPGPVRAPAEDVYTCLCRWKQDNGNVEPPAAMAIHFKPCWPHPPSEPHGFSVGFEDTTLFEGTNYWCLATPPPAAVNYTAEEDGEQVATFDGEHWRAPCGCKVEPHVALGMDAETGQTNWVATASSECHCVETGASEPVTLLDVKLQADGTQNVSPDFTKPPPGVATNLTAKAEVKNCRQTPTSSW